MLHALSTSILSPRQFTYPFCYDVDPLAEAASEELQHYIATTGLMSAEKGCGKMFGVLVVEYKDEEGALQCGFLAAYSGLLGGRNDWQYFVPPVFDAQQPDGHFKRTEREISAINREIAAIEHDAEYLQSVEQHEEMTKRLQAEVEAFKVEVDVAKARRDARRKSGEPLSEEEQAEMVRESQFMKAELRRRRKAMEQAESTFHNPHATLLKSLQRKRKQMSDELQRWLFSAYRMLNAKGEERDLIDIFREYTHAMPPAGAGDCCAPKLLQYAYKHRLRPVCMAEFWWGESPASEIRHHLHYYPACRSKCLPILTHMLKGLDVAPNPLAQKRHTAEPRVLYADEYILVVDKPAGMLSVPGKADDSASVSVEEYFANNSKLKIQNSKFLKAAHRLDMDTSGLLVLARTEQAYVELQRQFASRETMKRYEAVLSGVPKHIVGGYGIPAVAIANSCSHLYFYDQGLRQECRSLLFFLHRVALCGAVEQRFESQSVGVHAEAAYHAEARRRHHRLVAELLALVHVADVHFDDRRADRADAVEQRHRGVCVCAGVEDDAVRLEACFLQLVDEHALDVALIVVDIHVRILTAELVEILFERGVAVDARLA